MVPRAVTWLATEAGLEFIMGQIAKLPTWRERLVCSRCGSRAIDIVVTGTERR